MLKRNWRALGVFPFELQKDKQFVLAAVDCDWHALELLADLPKPDDEASDDEQAQYKRAKPNFWGDEDIVRSAVAQDWQNLLKAEETMWGEDFVDIVVSAVHQTIAVMELVLAMVNHDWKQLEFCTDKELWADPDILIAAMQQDLEVLNIIPPAAKKAVWMNRDIVLAAVKKNWRLIKKANEQFQTDPEIMCAAMEQDPTAMKSVSAEALKILWGIRVVMLIAVAHDWKVLKNADEDLIKDEELLLIALRQNWKVLENIPMGASKFAWESKACVIEVVKQVPDKLEMASAELQADPDVVKEAVKRKGVTLRFADPGVRKDPDVVIEAVKQDGLALKFAHPALKEDRSIVEAAVRQNPKALALAADALRVDPDLLLISEVKEPGA